MAPVKVDSYAINTETNWHNKGHPPIRMPSLKKMTFAWYAILPGAVKMQSIRDPLYLLVIASIFKHNFPLFPLTCKYNYKFQPHHY
jgi:hypothetical protein